MKVNLSFNLKKVRANSSVLLWLVLVVILILEGFSLQKSFKLLNDSINKEPEVVVSRSARINFEAYDQAVSRISGAETYAPEPASFINPFIFSATQQRR